MTEHKSDINLGFLTKHTLNVEGLNASNGPQINDTIDKLPGVDGVWLDESKKKIKISYDGSHHNIDENIKENAKHEAHCCNKMPPGTGGK